MPQVNTVAIFLIPEALRAWISLAFFLIQSILWILQGGHAVRQMTSTHVFGAFGQQLRTSLLQQMRLQLKSEG